jgi:uncharacterized protein YndB with AHSA1/START domain
MSGQEPLAEADPTDSVEVRVSRGVNASVSHVWEVLVSPVGTEALLGAGAVLGGKGEPYHCADGAHGVLRSYHPLEQLRVSWHADADGPASVVEVDLREDGGATVLDLNQQHLTCAQAEGLHDRWSAALDLLAQRAESW